MDAKVMISLVLLGLSVLGIVVVVRLLRRVVELEPRPHA